MMPRDVYTTGMIAKLVRVAPRTVTKWIDSGKLTGYKLPNANDRRVERKHLLRFLRANKMILDPSLFINVLWLGSEPSPSLRERLTAWADDLCIHVALEPFEAGALLAHTPIALAVADFALGRARLLALMAELRAKACKQPPAYVALVNEDETDVEEVERSGFAAVLRKPVNDEVVFAAVCAFILAAKDKKR